jgi:type IV secretory pathway TrbL component
MACPQSINTFLLGISGFFIVLPISLLFFLISSGGEKYLALIMIGFNFIVSASDFEVYLKLPLSDIITILIGSVIIVVGETLLIEKLVF